MPKMGFKQLWSAVQKGVKGRKFSEGSELWWCKQANGDWEHRREGLFGKHGEATATIQKRWRAMPTGDSKHQRYTPVRQTDFRVYVQDS